MSGAVFNGMVFGAGGGSSGTGDVVGPGSATDNAVARFDATTGKLIQNSVVTIADTTGAVRSGDGSVSLPTYGFTSDPNTGFYLAAADTLSAASGGNDIFFATPSLFIGLVELQGYGGVRIGVAQSYSWSDASNPNSGKDAGLARAAAGVVIVTDGSTGIGATLSSKLVEANTAGSGSPNILALTESGTVFTNEGATAENYHTLPTAVAGYEFTFVVQDTDGIRIVANTGDTIRPIAGTAASATGGFIRCATAGAFITLLAINSTEWISVGSAGVWTIDA